MKRFSCIMFALFLPAMALADVDTVRLPQDAPWKVTLRNWLRERQTADFTIAEHTFRVPEATAAKSRTGFTARVGFRKTGNVSHNSAT